MRKKIKKDYANLFVLMHIFVDSCSLIYKFHDAQTGGEGAYGTHLRSGKTVFCGFEFVAHCV